MGKTQIKKVGRTYFLNLGVKGIKMYRRYVIRCSLTRKSWRLTCARRWRSADKRCCCCPRNASLPRWAWRTATRGCITTCWARSPRNSRSPPAFTSSTSRRWADADTAVSGFRQPCSQAVSSLFGREVKEPGNEVGFQGESWIPWRGKGAEGKDMRPAPRPVKSPQKLPLPFDWTASNPFFSRPQSSNLETGVNERQVRRAENGEDSLSSFPLPARPCLSLAPVSQLLVVEEKRKGLRAVYPSPTHPPGVGPPFLHLCSFWPTAKRKAMSQK